jgi:lipopolysaccharide export system protein LptA
MKICFHFLILGMVALPFPLRAQQRDFPPPVTLAASDINSTNFAVPAAKKLEASTNSSASLTSTNAPADTNAVHTIDIQSLSGVFRPHEAIYIGNVHVVSPQGNLTCEHLTATSSSTNTTGRPDHIVAETNVVIDAVDKNGKPVHATAALAIWDYKVVGTVTNDIVELHGDPHIESASGPSTGDPIIWDRVANTVHATNPHMIIKTDANPTAPETQKPRTNAPPSSVVPTTPSIAPEKKPRE